MTVLDVRSRPGARVGRPPRRRWTLPPLTRRAVVRVARQPSLWVPALAFPLLLSAVFTSALASGEHLPGLSHGSYAAFSMPTTLFQATILAAIACGAERAEDIESRFNHRFLLAPINRATVTVSSLLCGATVSGAVAAGLLAAFAILGVSSQSGPVTPAAIVLLYAVLGAGFSGLVVAFAGWTGSVQSVLAAYPPFMLVSFFSTALVPRQLMAPWFAAIAVRNPVSWVLADVRLLYNEAWSVRAYLGALGVAVVLCAGSGLLAVHANLKRGAT